jgi:tetratricopeptide (TPR) repeat protein
MLIAANAAWFYVAKFVAPIDLSPIYPRWVVSADDWRWWLAVGAWLVLLLCVVRGHRRIGLLPQWGIAHFFIALAPTLGLVSWGYLEFSFVADHFLYLSLLGGGLSVALWARRAAGVGSSWTPRRIAVTVVGGSWLVGIALQTYGQTQHWQDNLAFWRHVVEQNPDEYLGNLGLGVQYDSSGEPGKAIPYLRTAARARPRLARPFRRYVGALGKARGPQAAIAACNEKITQQPRFVVAYLERALHAERLGRTDDARRDYQRVQQSMPESTPLWREAAEGLRRLVPPARLQP